MSQPGFAGQQRIVDIPVSTGQFLPILATTTSRRVVIQESTVKSDGTANTLIGSLQFTLPNDGTTNGFTTVFIANGATAASLAGQGAITPAQIVLGNPIAGVEAHGEIVGQVGQQIIGLPVQAATTLIKIKSGAAATSVAVIEYN